MKAPAARTGFTWVDNKDLHLSRTGPWARPLSSVPAQSRPCAGTRPSRGGHQPTSGPESAPRMASRPRSRTRAISGPSETRIVLPNVDDAVRGRVHRGRFRPRLSGRRMQASATRTRASAGPVANPRPQPGRPGPSSCVQGRLFVCGGANSAARTSACSPRCAAARWQRRGLGPTEVGFPNTEESASPISSSKSMSEAALGNPMGCPRGRSTPGRALGQV